MGKLKLIFVSLLSMLAWNGAFAENIETDVTAQFPLDWQGWTGATGFVGWAAPQVETNDGRTTAACEQYNEGTIASTGVVFSRKLTGLANGNYTIELYGAAAFTPGRSCSSTLEEGDETAVHLYAETPAGTVVQPIPAHVATDFNGTGIATAKLEGVQVTDGTVTIGMYKDKGLTNWHVVQIKGVTAVVDKDELLASLFQPLVDALAAGEAIKANVPSESEAIATYDAAVADAVAANANRTLDFDVASAVEVVKAAAKELSKAQTAPGSDLTAFIVNPEANGASDAVTGWTADKPNGGNGPMKPSGDAIEYWAGNANPRAEAQFDIWQEITGLPNGKYTVSADMYNSLNGEGGDYTEFSPTCGVYAAAGDVEVVKLVDVEGDALNTYTTDPIEVTDGTLRIGVKNVETPMAARWFVADNFKLTLVELAEEPVPVDPYEAALEAIEDGKNYRVFTEVDGEKYYLTALGVLDSKLQKAGVFNFKKIEGGEYEYGFQLTSPMSYRFTNPYGNTDPWLTNGRITVTDGTRNTFEAQVFFMNEDGKFAVRGTNADYDGETSGWAYISNSYWVVNEGPVAEYSFEPAYIWQLEEAEADNRQEILSQVRPVVESWGKMLQDIDGLVTDASMYYANSKANESIGLPGLLDGDYGTYFHTMWGNSGVTEAHYLEATLPDAADKFYYYFVKRDPVNNGNVNNRPIHIAISGSNDGETFTPITEVDDMPLTVPPVNYMSELITADQAYKIIRFTVLDTNNHATDNNGNKFFTFSEFYILPSNELTDAATALLATDYTDIPLDTEGYVEQVEEMDAILKGYFKDVDLNLVLNGETKATETINILVGKEAPAAPASFYTNADVVSEFGGLVYFTRDVDEIAEETTEINYTAESAISESFEDAKWFNMNIRGNYWVTMDETEPYYPTEDKDLEAEASQWAFGAVEGEPAQIVIWNRAAGPDMSLLNTGESDSNGKPLVAMREGQTAWDFAPNSDGFVIHQVGTGENEWVNQNGGATGPFSIWDSGNAKGDAGSVLRIYPVEEPEPVDPYEAALASIEDSGSYRIFTEVDGEKYYVTAEGYLDAKENAGQFTFEKVTKDDYNPETNRNLEYQYGFLLNSQKSTRFSNPYDASEEWLTNGHLNSVTNNRVDWEAQVFLQSGGKYAIRATNAPYNGETSSWAWIGNTYWTAYEGDDGPFAGYSFDMESNYIWQLEGPLSVINVKYELYEADGTKVKEETKKQENNSEIDIPIAWTAVSHNSISHPILYYDFTTEGEIGNEDCVIKVTRTMKDGVVLSLDELSNEKSYIIGCDRGALLTSDDHLASNDHVSLADATPTDFAVISYEDNFYLYSIADGKFVTFEPSASPEGARGPLADMPTHGTDDALKMNPSTQPYFLTYFSVNGTNYGLNTNGNNPYGYVINTWMNADPGNLYYFIESGEFDPTEALAALDAYFHPSVFVTYVIKDADGNELLTSEPQPARPNDHITSLPDALKRIYTEYSDIDVTITDEETTIEVTATWNGPIVLADEYDNITWQNLYLNRGTDNLWYLNIGEETQFLTQNPSDDDLAKDEFQWGFVGNPYAGLKIYNKATGEAQTLTSGDAIGMADGEFVWNLLAANAEGILIGTDGGYINQWGGATGTNLGLWGSTTDMGSTFYAEVVEVEPLEEGEYNGVIRQILSHPQTGVQGEATGKQTIAITDGEEEGTVDITFSGFTMPVTGAELPEFTVEGVEKTENEDGTISYELPGWAPNKVVIDRGTGTVTYKVTLTGSQESEDATPVLKLTLENSVVDTVWFAASQSDIDDAIEADEATAIRGINGLEDAGIIFDLSGRKVAKIQHGGIYIVNGKKISVK